MIKIVETIVIGIIIFLAGYCICIINNKEVKTEVKDQAMWDRFNNAKISIYCPPMKIVKINNKLHKTAVEPMKATITFDPVVIVENVIIPETLVNRIKLLHWEVAECIGRDKDKIVTVYLPKEPVLFDFEEMAMVAQKIKAQVVVQYKNDIWRGTVTFPDCRTDLFTMTAEAVTATGEITK